MADTKKYSELQSALRGAGQTASLGFSDELEGALDAAKDAYNAGQFSKLKEMLGPRIAQARQANANAQAQNPKSYMTGQAAGVVGSSFIPGLGLANAGGEAAGLARALNYAKSGALLGGITAAGNANLKDLSPNELQRVGTETAKGAAIGGALAPITGPLAAKATSKFERLQAELQPRGNLPSAAPQNVQGMLNKFSPDELEQMGINSYKYAPDVDQVTAQRLRNGVDQQVARTPLDLSAEAAPYTNVPSDTVNISDPDSLNKMKRAMP